MNTSIKRCHFSTYSVLLLLLICLCTLFSCIKPTKNTLKTDEELFLENVMIREKGLYVLMGSKPMSSFTIDAGFPENKEEAKEYYKQVVKDWEKDHPYEQTPSFEEFNLDIQQDRHCHTRYLWNHWTNTCANNLSPRYMFVARKNPFGRQSLEGLFVNKQNLHYILEEHRIDFEKIVNEKYDSSIMIEELNNVGSPFWEKVFASNFLQGLLFGYGTRNAFLFSNDQYDPHLYSIVDMDNITLNRNITIDDLQLPPVTTYSLGDPILEKYKKEKESILSECRKKGFKPAVYDWLYNSK